MKERTDGAMRRPFFVPGGKKGKIQVKNRNRPVPFSFVLAFPVKLRPDFHREPIERNGKKWMKNC
ncbi:hypothetical protein [uncultured Oscillibacter sp.]|uniref:hypothetical protein n=1 Tax=uncultured Oscillibacter sp. TaxID=876091 RepID=UPI00280B0C96|nr:hypothetical protein [uncultured Oscillibacter sp.]